MSEQSLMSKKKEVGEKNFALGPDLFESYQGVNASYQGLVL